MRGGWAFRALEERGFRVDIKTNEMLRVNITCGDEAYLVRCYVLEHELRSWEV